MKDGNNALSYGWYNKVMNIRENGKTVADYDYSVDVLFNDMLGSTLGVAVDGKYNPINRTSFGETSDNSDCNFFTGKPNVEGLGYTFVFA